MVLQKTFTITNKTTTNTWKFQVISMIQSIINRILQPSKIQLELIKINEI